MNLAKLSIRRPIFITCIVILMLVFGYFSLTRMSVDMFPDVTFPVLFVQTAYPGASPIDIEKLVSKPIEDELGGISGLKTLTSSNLEGVSIVVAEFDLGTNVKDAEQSVREKLGNIRRKLPTEILEPIIRRFDPSDRAILRVGAVTDLPPAKAYDVVNEKIKPLLERVQGVGLVQILGGRKREIQILVDQKKLQDRNLSVLGVASKIAATSKDVPVGKITASQKDTVVRAQGEFSSLKELKEVAVSFFGSDQVIKVKDIATVNEGLETEKTRSTLNGQQALFIDIFKQSGVNTVEVAKQLEERVAMINQTQKEVVLKSIRDGARPIKINVDDVYESIRIGILLCVIVVFLFLGSGRSTFITGMALPNSLLGAFIVMYAMGFTINMMTLMALSLAVGLLVDDAIVVRENIFRHLEMGMSPEEAAEKGTNQVALAVVATTLVVIAVFGPIAFLQGMIGQFFKQFGLTIVFAMIISLFDSMTVAPMLSAMMATTKDHVKSNNPIQMLLGAFDRFQTWLENGYAVLLRFCLHHRKVVIFVTSASFAGSLALIPYIPKTFMPSHDFGEFAISVEMKSGTSLEGTAQFLRRVEEVVKANPTVEVFASVVGTTEGESHKANIFITLKPTKQRKQNTSEVKGDLREKLKPLLSEARVEVVDVDFAGGQKPFNLNIRGDDLQVLSDYTSKLKARLAKLDGLIEVDTNFREGMPEYQIKFDRDKSEALGVSTAGAGAELRARVEGSVPAVFRDGGIEYDIRVKLQEQDRDFKKIVQTSQVYNTNYNMIPLSKIASGKETTGYSQINRQNKARYINIGGLIAPGGSMADLMKKTEEIMKTELPLPAGVEWEFKGQAKDFIDLMTNMVFAMFLGVVFIYLVLASLYESFVTPFTIILALPPAITGALIALLITKNGLDIFSMIGLVMLLGVVAKNSILLVDYTVQLVRSGVAETEAIVQAGRTRLRPILMTTLALIAGTMPIALGLSEASRQRVSMGVSIVGGLISSTLMTLVVVPSAFGYVESFRKYCESKFEKWRGRAS